MFIVVTFATVCGANLNIMKNDINRDWTKEWTSWAPRAEIAPRFAVDAERGENGGASLRIQGNGDRAAWGSWRKTVSGIRGGEHYHFTVRFRSKNVENPVWCISARVTWLSEKGTPARPPDFVLAGKQVGEWTTCDQIIETPAESRSALIELGLGWCPKGTVWWDEAKLVAVPAPKSRVVRALTLFHRPERTGSAAKSVEEFCTLLEGQVSQKPDIVCLPEGITIIGTGKKYVDVAEAVPGPTTERLGRTARLLKSYIVAGLFERVGNVIYNTAVLIDRKGEVVGTYRKTHLPREEVEDGLTPGNSYPVFDTDFGRVGLMICWDVQWPEAATALAAKGAEILLLPINGGNETLARARAIENHVFLISSSYDMKTFIVDPKGEVLAEAAKDGQSAVAELHLDRKIIQYWVGDMKPRTWKERRTDIKVD